MTLRLPSLHTISNKIYLQQYRQKKEKITKNWSTSQ